MSALIWTNAGIGLGTAFGEQKYSAVRSKLCQDGQKCRSPPIPGFGLYDRSQGIDLMQQVAVAEHDPFRFTSRAGGVDQGCQILGLYFQQVGRYGFCPTS